MLRVRRSVPVSQRIRRVRPATVDTTDLSVDNRGITRQETPVEAGVGVSPRIRRSRLPVDSLLPGKRPYFVIDWERALSWKFSIYMVTSYTYYQLNRSLITDHDYDRLCKELYVNFHKFTHQHKALVDRGQLMAGTGYAVKQFPGMVRGAAGAMLLEYCER